MKAINYIVVEGNPFDGLTLYGPFADENEATRYAKEECNSGETWWVCPMLHPWEVDADTEGKK